jgi:hypothetical protein
MHTAAAAAAQFLLRSTSRLALIHGIIARSFSPTFSISCSPISRRRASSVGAPARFSRMKLLAYSPVWMSLERLLHRRLARLVDHRGPVTYSPYSALFEIE